MSSASAAILLGLVLGSWASGISGWFFWFTRPYRKARNLLVMGFGYVVIGVSSVGSLWLLLGTSERMGTARKPEGYAALYAWTISFICVVILTVKSEIKWRRSFGAGGNKAMPPRDKGN